MRELFLLLFLGIFFSGCAGVCFPKHDSKPKKNIQHSCKKVQESDDEFVCEKPE